jgi:hypothetical protein
LAMSQENVEIVLESLRRAEANDVEGSAALMHPDIRATAVRGWPEAGPFLGQEAVLAETKRPDRLGREPLHRHQGGGGRGRLGCGRVPMEVRGEGSGIETRLDVAAAVRVKEARIIEWHNRWSRSEALQAAGLSQ